ncbi:hypothetical protein EZV73_13835 [Acidaminobacter sp. JC074]|uniref:hypothetical protein n=1 Tax=Acidaminobacter sp. JC074 TaxID=2530199 RepID=UPI001F0E2272|nr:hypothetical protein [Acidaminobacter sp. JC074]MCH4888669.1 hypothetical protein [Acidaminobacter sp. JC074]
MNPSYNQLFDEKDLLEENKFQTIYKGCFKDQPQKRVLIHKFKMDARFDEGFKDFIDNTLQNKLHVEIINDEIILVSNYIEGDNISLHLNFSDVSDQERIDYLYEYLHQATAYIGYDNYLLNILIGSSQVVFKDHKLYLKEHINLDRRINEDMPFTMVAKNMGQVMQRVLITNYNELKTSAAYDELHRFTESLIQREKDYKCFDDLFTDFKAIYFKKQHSKTQSLMGNAHPNNIFMEFVDVNEYDERNKNEIETKAVTGEERAILMGMDVSEDTKPELPVPEIEDPEPEIEDYQPEEDYEPEPIDWSKGPIEESIDLSKLEDANSLEELFVKEKKQKKTEPAPKEPLKEAEPVIEEPKVKKKIDLDEPVYGIPKHFKETNTLVEEEEEEEEKKAFNFLIPATIFAALLLVILGFMWIPSLFEKDVAPIPPEASFEVKIQGNKLICENTSKAFGEGTIVESYWEVSKDDKVLASETGKKNANFEAEGLTPGTYKIKLTVIDSNNLFSDPHVIEKEYQSPESKALENQIQTQNELASNQAFKSAASDEEQLDQFDMSTTINVVEDTSIYNKGTKSLKMEFEGSENSASLSFDSVLIPKGSTISFMIMSNKAVPIKVQVLGYNNNSNVYNKEIVSDKGTVLDWSIVSLQMSGDKNLDKLVIRLEAEDTIVWFDELSIRTFK